MRSARFARRARTIPGLFAAAVILTILIPLWAPLAIIFDAARLRFRLPTARLLAFGVCFTWLETAGILAAAWHWASGRARQPEANYRLMRWWSARLIAALKATTGLHVSIEGAETLRPGPVVLLCRHASLADSLVSAYAITTTADLDPRYVLKRELLFDPCLDVVGNRVPNHFLDRNTNDSEPELAALRLLSSSLGSGDVAVIFPEGTRSNPAKLQRALQKIAERNPERSQRLAGLRQLLPPRPSGAFALASGSPAADIAVGWHTGFEGYDTFGGILRQLSKQPRPIHFVIERIPRSQVPSDEAGFGRWLDDTWIHMDSKVHADLQQSHSAHD